MGDWLITEPVSQKGKAFASKVYDLIDSLEYLYRYLLTDGIVALAADTYLADESLGLDSQLAVHSELRFFRRLRAPVVEAELDGVVTVLPVRLLHRENGARARFDNGCWMNGSIFVEELRHPYLFSKYRLQHGFLLFSALVRTRPAPELTGIAKRRF